MRRVLMWVAALGVLYWVAMNPSEGGKAFKGLLAFAGVIMTGLGHFIANLF